MIDFDLGVCLGWRLVRVRGKVMVRVCGLIRFPELLSLVLYMAGEKDGLVSDSVISVLSIFHSFLPSLISGFEPSQCQKQSASFFAWRMIKAKSCISAQSMTAFHQTMFVLFSLLDM